MEAARYSTGWLKTVPRAVPVARFLISPLVSRAAYCVERRGQSAASYQSSLNNKNNNVFALSKGV
jgi:hypothetical protein